MQPAVLVHLSDIHFHAGAHGLAARMHAVRTQLMEDLAVMRTEVGDATAIVVTGDVAFSGEPEQYAVAREWLDSVSETVGASDALVLTVPGNHDVHWGSITASARIARQSLRTCTEDQVTPLIDQLVEDTSRPLLAALDNYNDFAVGYRCEVPADGLPWQAPLPLRHGYRLELRGLTTVFNSDRDDTRGSLVVGKTQTSLPLNEPGAVHVILAHHGPEDCRETTEIRDRLRHKAWALLCGHRHNQRVRVMDNCLEVTAGAVHPEDQQGYFPTYNWIKFDVAEDGTGNCQLIVDVWQRVMRPEFNRFSSGGEQDGPRREVFPLPPLSAPAASAHNASHSPTTPPADRGVVELGARATEVEPEGAAARPPLVDLEGQVDEHRRIARDLLDLPASEQERVLWASGLLTDADLDKDHVTMILVALARAKDPATLAGLADEIDRAASSD